MLSANPAAPGLRRAQGFPGPGPAITAVGTGTQHSRDFLRAAAEPPSKLRCGICREAGRQFPPWPRHFSRTRIPELETLQGSMTDPLLYSRRGAMAAETFTGRAVVGTPYHRNGGILDTYRILTATEDSESRSLLHRRGADLILLCPDRDEKSFSPRPKAVPHPTVAWSTAGPRRGCARWSCRGSSRLVSDCMR